MPNTVLTLYETRPMGSNYTPRDLMLAHAKENPHLFGRAYDHYGELRLMFQGQPYEYDHWQIEPAPKSRTEYITLFLTECRKES